MEGPIQNPDRPRGWRTHLGSLHGEPHSRCNSCSARDKVDLSVWSTATVADVNAIADFKLTTTCDSVMSPNATEPSIARHEYARRAQRYSSDLTDREWALIAPLLPGPRPVGRPRTINLREVVNAILYMASGCTWELLPKEFPPRS